jgi:hypothetical protein
MNSVNFSGDTLGIGPTSSPCPHLISPFLEGVVLSIGGGTRSSSAMAYLAPALSQLKFDVLINGRVTKLLQTLLQTGTKRIRKQRRW